MRAGAAQLRVCVLGPPGVGKGTQCRLISSIFGIKTFSTGQLIGAAVRNRTNAGTRAQPYVERREWVPNEIVNDIVKENLMTRDCQQRGWCLDGFPKTIDQATYLFRERCWPNVVIWLNCHSDQVLVDRTLGRRIDSVTGDIFHVAFIPAPEGTRLTRRNIDTRDLHATRLRNWKRDAPAVKRRFSGIIREINGNRGRDIVFREVEGILDRILHPRPPTPPSPDSYPCIAGWCLVEMSTPTTPGGLQYKPIRDLKKGDFVRSAGGTVAKVECILRTVTEGYAELVQLTPGLAITAHHPVRIDGIWQQPEKLGEVRVMPCDDLYLFLLSEGHSLFIDGIECVGLAHGFTENEVISHGYFGTSAVVEDLKRMKGWEEGLVVIRAGQAVKRHPVTRGVIGIQSVE